MKIDALQHWLKVTGEKLCSAGACSRYDKYLSLKGITDENIPNRQWVTIKGDDKDQLYKVFVDDASHFPLRFVMTKKINTSKGVVEFTQKAQVTRSMDWLVGDSKFIFPLTVEMKGQRSGGEVHEVTSNITSVVKINQPIKNKNIFTIPRSQANVITNHDEKK